MRLGKLRYESKFMAIKFFAETKHWSINWMCKQLEISRSAYYKWLHREVPGQELENINLAYSNNIKILQNTAKNLKEDKKSLEVKNNTLYSVINKLNNKKWWQFWR